MPYVERVTRAGKTIEVERYYTARYRKTGSKRAKKIKPTSEQQEKINNKQAERKLRLIITRTSDTEITISFWITSETRNIRTERRKR